MKLIISGLALSALFISAACSEKAPPAQKVSLHDATPQQTRTSAGSPEIVGLPRVLPVVSRAGAHLTVEAPRWGAGDNTLQFDLLYTGLDEAVECGYQEYDSTGDPVGPGGLFPLKSGEKTTESLSVTGQVATVKLTLPRA